MNTINYKTLDYEYKIFGFKVASILSNKWFFNNIKRNIKELQNNDIVLVYIFVNPSVGNFNRIAKGNKAHLVDEKITFSKKISKSDLVDKCDEIFSYIKKPLSKNLEELAHEAGKYSRFKIDTRFKNNEFKLLYTDWITKSLSGEITKDLLVYKKSGREAGFVTLGEKDGNANIGLIAVNKLYQRQNIGNKLMKEAINKAIELGFREVNVVTQKSNEAACNFYQKLGFREKSLVNVYHLWLK